MTIKRVHHLVVRLGRLYFFHHEGDILLIRHYPAGDIDTCPWPMRVEFEGDTIAKQRENLALALYDLRETCDSSFSYGDVVQLPNGEEFPFDQIVAEYKPSREEF